MILYLDATALLKRYVAESGSADLAELVGRAELVGTAPVTRTEVAATLSGGVATGLIGQDEAKAALQLMRREWTRLVRVRMTEVVIAMAEVLAWEFPLRGNAALHLASALRWQESLEAPVTLATFDAQLGQAAQRFGLEAYPPMAEIEL